LTDSVQTPPAPVSFIATSVSPGRNNLLAGLAGQAWSALLQVALAPLLIALMGIESFGLVGFFLVINGVAQIFDLGLSPTMSRELARVSARADLAAYARDFVRTVETGYWAIGVALGIVIAAAAPIIATRWINAGSLSGTEVHRALVLMGAAIALQWPMKLYEAGLVGLQRIVPIQLLGVGMRTLGAVGTVLILWRVSSTPTAFFLWQIVMNGVHVAALAALLRRNLPPAPAPGRFNPGAVRSAAHFAAGMTGISVSAVVLMNADKLILSKVLSLGAFGYYSLAATVANALYLFILPMFNTVFPMLVAGVAARDGKKEREVYHLGSQAMAVLIVPVTAIVSFFATDILLLWTGNAEAAVQAGPIVRVLVVGTALNGLMNAPYALQLAHGWTSIGLRLNWSFVLALVPAALVVVPRYGGVGAAWVWLGLNATYMLAGVPLTHRRLLKSEAARWLVADTLLPAAAAVLVVWVAWLARSQMSVAPVGVAIGIVVALAGSWLAAICVAPETRRRLRSMLPSLALLPSPRL